MNDVRVKRQKAIAALIQQKPVGSQEEVSERLAELGYAVTQATISRDLEQLGAVKVKQSGLLRYALPEQIGPQERLGARLEQIFAEWVFGVEPAGSLVVLRTPPGSAHLVALAIDQARLPEVGGTIAGDDTLFVAVRDSADIAALTSRFREMSGQ